MPSLLSLHVIYLPFLAISAKVERLFSSTKLMLPPRRSALLLNAIEAGECIKSWVKGGLFIGDYFDYISMRQRKQEHFREQDLGWAIFRTPLCWAPWADQFQRMFKQFR